MKANVKVEFEEKYYDILKEMANKEFRTIKATIELIVVQHIDNRITVAKVKNEDE